MLGSGISFRGRWLPPAAGALLFLLAFGAAFLFSLSRDVLLRPLRSALAGAGMELSAADARIVLPLGVRLTGASVSDRDGGSLSADSLTAGMSLSGIVRALPWRLDAKRGRSEVELFVSPIPWNPGRGHLRIANLSSDDLSAMAPFPEGVGFRIDALDTRWSRPGRGRTSGSGGGTLGTLRIPVPAKDSPVREAALDNVSLRFTIRNGNVQISSLTGIYEGSRVDGTGVISGVADPSRATITLHLRIQNPTEGRVATLFDMMSRNAKNANLRITGTLLAPSGEFQFF
jgi:hypothetical protein